MPRELDSFQTELLTELKDHVTRNSRLEHRDGARDQRRPRRFVPIAAAATLVLVAGGGLMISRPEPSFAVSDGPYGTIEVEVNRLEDAPQLEAALRARGVKSQVEYRSDGMLCQEDRYEKFERKPAPGEPPSRWSFSFGEAGISIVIDAREVPEGTTLVLTATRYPDEGTSTDGVGAQIGIAEGPVAPCIPTDRHKDMR